MREIRELSPGVLLVGSKMFLCPACGLKRWARDPMDREDVFMWLEATLSILKERGVKGITEGAAERLTESWLAGGYRSHTEDHDHAR